MERWDAIIAGHGLAGATLAWELQWAGCKVLVIDREEEVTSSRIAAGLITPITGQRIAESWRVQEMLPAAAAFYRKVEAATGCSFYHVRKSVRLFHSADELRRWESKRHLAEIQAHLTDPQPLPLVPQELADASLGGFEMHSAQLDVAGFLAASRRHLISLGAYRAGNVEVCDADDAQASVRVEGMGSLSARRVIFCQGAAARGNPLFSWVPFKAAKGEILTLEIPDMIRLAPDWRQRPLHRDVWLAPAENGRWRAGSTYDWTHLDTNPTAEGAADIRRRLEKFLRLPIATVGHHAAVRPIIRESKAVIGLHPVKAAVGFFNGLGSKGSLHAPFFAAQFASHLCGQGGIENEFDLRKNF